jgi:hypothetical protein
MIGPLPVYGLFFPRVRQRFNEDMLAQAIDKHSSANNRDGYDRQSRKRKPAAAL